MRMRTEEAVHAALSDVLNALPDKARRYYSADRRRIEHDADLAVSRRGTVVDVGSGFSPLAATLSRLGMRAIMLDRFDYPRDEKHGIDAFEVGVALERLGVERITTDLEEERLPVDDASVQVVTCLAVIEHLHHSPKKLLAEFRRILVEGGRVVVSAPNAVNLRKRFSVMRGKTNFPSIRAFYAEGDPAWFGHVREPTADELRWLLRKAGFRKVRVFGKNFVGEQNYGFAARAFGPLLELRPGLCSDLYAIGTNP